jgi:putative hydrolase of the HAD superfamily
VTPILALDVDGVVLDPQRGGRGHWTGELSARYGITRAQLRDSFFAPYWPEVIVGRRAIEPTLAVSLRRMGVTQSAEDVLACWFEADFVPVLEVVTAARSWAAEGVTVVLATNQEHRRVAYLRDQLDALLPVSDVLYSADLGFEKHDDRFWVLAGARLGVSDADPPPLLVDDDLRNVETAQQCGWSGVHFTGQPGWKADVARALRLTGQTADPLPRG